MPAILKGIQALIMLILHISKRNEVGYHNLLFTIIYIPLGIILIVVAAFSNWLIVPTLIGIGLITSRIFDKMMRAKAGDQKDEVLPEDLSKEHENTTILNFEIVDARSMSTHTSTAFREQMIERAESRLRKNLGRDLLLMLIYFMLATVPFPGFSKAVQNIGWGILASIVARWLFMGKLYRPVDAESKRLLLQHPFRIYGQELATRNVSMI